MKRKYVFLFIAISLLFIATGCANKCSDEEYATFDIFLKSPGNGALISYQDQLNFDWGHYEECNPFYYQVTLRDLQTNNISRFNRTGPETYITKSGYNMALKPNRDYEWTVKAMDESYLIFSPESETFTFKTDGLCEANELVPPLLLTPPDGSWKKFGAGPNNARLEWRYPDECFPEFYHYQLAADPEFNTIITSGITDFSDQYSLYWPVEGEPWIRSPHSYQRITIPECSRIYWRVRARRGISYGDYSEVFMFTNASDFGCWQNQQSIDASVIKGFVFEDICDATVPYVPEGVGIWPPCVFGEPYGVHGDGARAHGENGESGIPLVVVDLGPGPCPSTGLDQFVTTENGFYYFMVQSPGQYCVSIDKANNPDLDHGIWTLPLTDQDITEATISFNPGDDLIMQDFGWDQNDFLKIDFYVDLISFCRLGDSKDHLAVAEVPAGTVIPIFARNEEATWFATLVNGKRCFISTASGEPAEDPANLMIFPKQPDPIVPEETPDPNSKRCSDYNSEETCMARGCEWVWATAGPGFCRNP